MKKEDFAYIGCKLLALYWLVNAFHLLASFVSSVFLLGDNQSISFSSNTALYFSYFPLIVHIIFATIFWFGAKHFVGYIFSEKYETSNTPATNQQVQTIAFATVGLILIFMSTPEIINVFYKLHILKELDSYSQTPTSVKAQIIELSLKIVLGFLIFFGSKGLSGLLLRVREAGLK